MQRRAPLLIALAVGASWLVPAAASADQVKYVGVHPRHGGGVCHIELPHIHTYTPRKSHKKAKLLYRNHQDHHYFVGDPVAHGYDGDTVTYYGHHPVAVDVVAGVHVDGAPHHLEYCYLDGPHFHAFAPAPDLTFEVKGDAHWYVGELPDDYRDHRKAMVRVNAVYKPVKYSRPVVEVEPPAAYVEVHGAVVAPHVRIEAPVAPRVRAGLDIEIGIPGVVVIEEDHHHHHYKHKHKKVKYKKRRGVKRGHWKRHKRGRH